MNISKFICQRNAFTKASLAISRCISSFKASDLKIHEKPEVERTVKSVNFENLKFGCTFSDHMLCVKHANGRWHAPEISPMTELRIHPAIKALHYGIEVFEGMKAYHGQDGIIRMFRPELNMKRMRESSKRIALPDFDGDEFVECIKELIRLDADWVPKSPGKSLYIRPTHIGTEPTLGVGSGEESLLYVITGPVGPYYPTGFKPISLLADPAFVRAWPGGAGNFKIGANYAPTIILQNEAIKRNCQQVLWLTGRDQLITEVGTMNIFILIADKHGKKKLITPPRNGTILPGITRQSLLDLARKWNEFEVKEEEMPMKKFLELHKANSVLEVFGSGTACVVSPVNKILYDGKFLEIPIAPDDHSITMRFWKELNDIQYGINQDHEWAIKL